MTYFIALARLPRRLPLSSTTTALFHYLSEREYLQMRCGLVADELDYLDLYLATGFQLRELHDAVSIT